MDRQRGRMQEKGKEALIWFDVRISGGPTLAQQTIPWCPRPSPSPNWSRTRSRSPRPCRLGPSPPTTWHKRRSSGRRRASNWTSLRSPAIWWRPCRPMGCPGMGGASAFLGVFTTVFLSEILGILVGQENVVCHPGRRTRTYM